MSDKSSVTVASSKKGLGTAANSTAVVLIALMASVFFLSWAQSVFAPLVLAVLLSYALYPVVSLLNRFLIPRVLGSLLVVLGLVSFTFFAGLSLQNQALELLDDIPEVLENFNRLQDKNTQATSEESVLEKVQKTAIEIEKVTTGDELPIKNEPADGLQRVVVQEKRMDIRGFILGGSMGGLVLLSQYLTILLLVLFILSSGNLYKHKLVKISGDTLSEKKITVNILDDINNQLRRYFFVMLIGAVFVGAFTTLAFWWFKFEEAALWGTIAGVLSVIPYLGPAIVFVACGLVAFVQFETVTMGLTIAFTSLIITSIQGNILTPLLTSRASSLNAVGIFIGLLFWGWLWGPIGLIVATPIQMIVKSVCDHITDFHAVGELLGD